MRACVRVCGCVCVCVKRTTCAVLTDSVCQLNKGWGEREGDTCADLSLYSHSVLHNISMLCVVLPHTQTGTTAANRQTSGGAGHIIVHTTLYCTERKIDHNGLEWRL